MCITHPKKPPIRLISQKRLEPHTEPTQPMLSSSDSRPSSVVEDQLDSVWSTTTRTPWRSTSQSSDSEDPVTPQPRIPLWPEKLRRRSRLRDPRSEVPPRQRSWPVRKSNCNVIIFSHNIDCCTQIFDYEKLKISKPKPFFSHTHQHFYIQKITAKILSKIYSKKTAAKMDNKDWAQEFEVVDDSEYHKTDAAEQDFQRRKLKKWIMETFFGSKLQVLKWITLLVLFVLAGKYGVMNLYIIFAGIFMMCTNTEKRYLIPRSKFTSQARRANCQPTPWWTRITRDCTGKWRVTSGGHWTSTTRGDGLVPTSRTISIRKNMIPSTRRRRLS